MQAANFTFTEQEFANIIGKWLKAAKEGDKIGKWEKKQSNSNGYLFIKKGLVVVAMVCIALEMTHTTKTD